MPDYTEEELAQMKRQFIKDIRETPNNYSKWAPAVRSALSSKVRMANSKVVRVPDEIFDAFFNERPAEDEVRVQMWIHEEVMPVINSFPEGRLFLKNGCFSGKFIANTMCILDDRNEENVTSHLMSIQQDALLLETSGYLEVVIEEWIPTPPDNPTIYYGLPLREEMRLFYDFTNKKPCFHEFYWNYNYLHESIEQHCEEKERNDFESNYEQLFENYKRLVKKHLPIITEALSKVNDLDGIWSVDFILEEDCVWLIDMAIGYQNYYDKSRLDELSNDE